MTAADALDLEETEQRLVVVTERHLGPGQRELDRAVVDAAGFVVQRRGLAEVRACAEESRHAGAVGRRVRDREFHQGLGDEDTAIGPKVTVLVRQVSQLCFIGLHVVPHR
mgnify:CR=1 FL=1